ncbi:guanine nucleotide binding protein, alpha subunit [Obelidium mucronatum]|nr:guanine nucleotide binding protein, alpha subunit [Obelidium mucronatum]
MGCSSSTNAVDQTPEEVANSKKIDQQIAQEKKNKEEAIRLLLLGPGESGKSTVLKQMKLIYSAGFTPQEIQIFRSAILLNLLQCCKCLMSGMKELKIPYGFDPIRDGPRAQVKSSAENNKLSDSGTFGDAVQLAVPMARGGTMKKVQQDGPFFAPLDAPELPTSQSTSNTQDSSNMSSQSNQMVSNRSQNVFESRHSVAEGRTPDPDGTALAAQKIYDQMAVRRASISSADEDDDGIFQQGPVPDAARLLKAIDTDFGFNKDASIPEAVVSAIKLFWKDSGVQYCFRRANEFQLIDSCLYVMENLTRITTKDYIPTEQDMLRARITTVAVTETRFILPDKANLVVFDVGGQRSERTKWAPFFDDAQAIIFVIAISAFDQVCLEDSGTNRMVESMNLFGSICNHPLFKKMDMILFLNKIDVFREKLEKTRVNSYFPGYVGDNSFDTASKYFINRFLSINKYPNEKQIYAHLTWATDTAQIKKVLDSVNTSIAKSTLQDIGIM